MVKKYIIQGYQCGGVGLADSLKQMKIYSIYLIATLGQVSPVVFFDTKRQRAGVQNGDTPKKNKNKNKKNKKKCACGGERGVPICFSVTTAGYD